MNKFVQEIMRNTQTGEEIPVSPRNGKEVDEWDMLAALRKAKKQGNWRKAPLYLKILREHGFEVHLVNGQSQHYRIGKIIDYWPTTGTFINIRTRKKGHGIQALLDTLLALGVPRQK